MLISAIIRPSAGWHSHLPHEYLAWFKQIAALGEPTLLFLDRDFVDEDFPSNVTVERISYAELPLARFIEAHGVPVELPMFRNETKDNEQYLVIQNSKTFLVYQALAKFPNAPTYTWIDAGAPHFMSSPKALEPLITALPPFGKVKIPGIENMGYTLDGLHWRFAGSCFTGDAMAIAVFHEACMRVLYTWLPKLTWEINVWGAVEFLEFAPIEWVYGDHNDSLLANL